MKYICAFLILGFISPVFAADEFGARFSKTAPAALGGMPEAMGPPFAFNPADIEPAAGTDSKISDKIPAKIDYTGPEQMSGADMTGAAKPLAAPLPPQPLQ